MPPLSPHRPGVCSFKPNAENSNRISQALKHFTGKGRTAPQPKCSQESSQQETNTPMPKKPESASSITHPNYQGLTAGSRTSAGKRLGCWHPWNFQGLHCSPTTPLSHISQTTNFPSAVPCTTPHYTHKAPAFLTHLWEHLGTEDRITLSEQTCGQLQLQTLCRVSPCQSLLVQEQSHGTNTSCHSSQSFPTTHCSAPFHGKSDPGAGELLWSSAEPQEM